MKTEDEKGTQLSKAEGQGESENEKRMRVL